MHIFASMLSSFSSCAPLPLCSYFMLHFMLCALTSFYVFRLLHTLLVLCTTSFYSHVKLSGKGPHSSMFYVFLSCQVLYEIFHTTLHLLWRLYWVCSSLVAYPKIIFLLCQCDPSSSLSHLSLSSLLQLQSLTLFHLLIVSVMSLHSTGSYLKTLHLL
jgi:hypothetical protein